MPTINVTDSSFESDVLGAATPVIVDFWSETRAPCKQMAPILERLSDDFAGRAVIAKMNIDTNKETPANFAVRGAPTLLVFKRGKPGAIRVGAAPKSMLEKWIKDQIDNPAP